MDRAIGLGALHGLAAASDSVIVAVGGSGYAMGFIWRTEDQGENWMRVTDTLNFELRDVAFVSDEVGFACGYGAILKTSDGGIRWDFTPARNEFFSAMHFQSAQLGYAVGRTGTILKTEDQGESWIKLRNGNTKLFTRHYYNDIVFTDTDQGFIVGDSGLLLHTTDEGRTWNRIATPTKEHLYSINPGPEGVLFIGGDHGTFLVCRLP